MSTLGAVASDIGTGITELPRAALKGARDSVQETANFGAELVGGSVPQLPEVDAPKSNTGKFAASLSQFAVAMIGLGKVMAPIKAVSWAAKAVKSTGQAAAVGAIAFDPKGPRFSDVVESIDGLSNPVTGFLASDPNDSRAMGRMKNAMESIGMDALVIGTIAAGSKAFKAYGDLRAGKITPEEFQKAVGDVEKAELKAARAAEAPTPAPSSKTADEVYGEWDSLHKQAGIASDRQQDAVAAELRAKADAIQSSLAPEQAARLDQMDLAAADVTDAATRARQSTGITADRGVRVRELSRQMADLPSAGTVPDSRTLSVMQEVFDAESKAGGDPLGLLREAADTRLQFYLERGATKADAEEIVREQSTRLAASLGLKEAQPVAGLPSPPTQALAAQADEAGVVVSQVDGAPAGAPAKAKPLAEISDEQVASVVASTKADMDALAAAGSWEAAINNGYKFGKGERVQWQKLLNTEAIDGPGGTALGAYVARVADTLAANVNKARGGNEAGVLTDSLVDAGMAARLRLWGEDPVAFVGLMQTAGKNARTAVQNYEAGLIVAHKAVQDSYGMAVRIKAGDLSEWGGDAVKANEALKGMLQVVATLGGEAEALKASFGRGLRRSRSEFAIKPKDLENLNKLDPEELATAIANAGADPRALRKLANPSMWERLQDGSQWLLVNNLLWGMKTHFVNTVTNGYMLMSRPMERYIGSVAVGGEAGQRIRAEALQQYAYLGHVIPESFTQAYQSFMKGDSILNPHMVESFRQGINSADFKFRPMESFTDVLYNALAVPTVNVLGFPTRALGTVDELVKQTVYRSKIAARAHVEAAEQGLDAAAHKAYVQKAIADAFDDAGRATDTAALQEARTATFSQDLLPNTVGSGVQHLTNKARFLRIVVPFVRTPTNVIRYGIKLTPGLNVLQGEYRAMLNGAMGPEAQAQAVGQMSMGVTFIAAAAWLASEGKITGGGPSDVQLNKRARESGFQPYAWVSTDAKGQKTYTAFGKYDPVGMAFGVIADLVAAMDEGDENDAWYQQASDIAVGLSISLAKQMANKTYLTSLNQAMDAVMDPDRSMGKFVGQTAANFIPAASMLRQINPDPHLRDTREWTDRLLATVPGLSDKLPPKRNVFGEPVIPGRGLYVTSEMDAVDSEIRRMSTEAGVTLGPPSPSIEGVDLRDIKLANGRTAYDMYQDLAGRPSPNAPSLKERVAAIMKTPTYQKAPDGAPELKGTKLSMITGVVASYRNQAMQRLRADPKVREELFKRQEALIDHYKGMKAEETKRQVDPAADIKELGRAFGIDFLGTKQ